MTRNELSLDERVALLRQAILALKWLHRYSVVLAPSEIEKKADEIIDLVGPVCEDMTGETEY